MSVCADAGALRLRPAAAVPDELRGALLQLKPELLALLQSGAASGVSTPHAPTVATAPADAPRRFDAGEAYRRARAAEKPTTAPDVPAALLEYPDRVFDEVLRVWRRGEFIEYTTGTAPAYRKLIDGQPAKGEK